MDKEICNILCIEKEQEINALIELKENDDCVVIKFSCGKLQFEEYGENYFVALVEIRKKLEKLNIKLLCKGCCRNVYPSGMLLNMGTGRKAYTLTYGEQARMSSLVDIFDICTLDEYATIDEQLEYFDKWIMSLRR
ncbi:MAG: hypothetical protein E7263_04395 [Lachnospiraceae bacterium]|nr:hypothetical protein [Lachnospiraceae bacterium]